MANAFADRDSGGMGVYEAGKRNLFALASCSLLEQVGVEREECAPQADGAIQQHRIGKAGDLIILSGEHVYAAESRTKVRWYAECERQRRAAGALRVALGLEARRDCRRASSGVDLSQGEIRAGVHGKRHA